MFPAELVESRGDDVTIHANAFLPENALTRNGQPCYIELRPDGQDDCGGSWEAGDSLIVAITVIPDAAARAFYGKQHIYFNSNCKTGTPCRELSQSWSVAGPEQRIVMIGTCPAAGSGLRIYMFPQTRDGGPPGDITLTVNAEIRKLPSVAGGAPLPAANADLPGGEQQQSNTDRRLRPALPAWASWAYPLTLILSALVGNGGVWCFILGYLHRRERRTHSRWLLAGGLCLTLATLGLLGIAFALSHGYLL